MPTKEEFRKWLVKQPTKWLNGKSTETIFVQFAREWLLNTENKYSEMALIINEIEKPITPIY